MEGEYLRALSLLNEKQRQAVETIDGPVIVIAGPGTGKTQVLATRIAHIIHKTDTPPHGILALTFTDAGVQAMRKRLKSLMGKRAYEVNIHTFHGLAHSLIAAYPDYFPKIIGGRQIDGLEAYEIIESILKNNTFELIKPYGDPLYYVQPIISKLQDIQQEGYTPAQFKELVDNQVKEFEHIEDLLSTRGKTKGEVKKKYLDLRKRIDRNYELLRVYELYEEEKHKRRVFDYDDSIIELLQALRGHDEFKALLQERYLYLLVDEHQDSNGSQNKIIRLLTDYDKKPNLFIVGDDKQAIFRFQGASPQNFSYFFNLFDSHVIELEDNYRSHQGILDSSFSLISNNENLVSKKELKQASERSPLAPLFSRLETSEDEATFVASEIENLLKTEEGTVAVLYRNNADAYYVERALSHKGIAYDKSSSSSEVHMLTRQLLALLSLGVSLDDTVIRDALFSPLFNLNPHDIVTHFMRAQRGGSLLEVHDTNEPVRAALQRIVEIHAHAKTVSFFEFFDFILYDLGFMKALVASPLSREVYSEVQSLHTVAKMLDKRETFFSIELFLDYVTRGIERKLLKLRRQTSTDTHRVRLSTVHGAKGLEYDSVFIIGLDDRRWGTSRNRERFYLPEFKGLRVNEDESPLDDDRRLLYVALTRAKERLVLTAPRFDMEKELIESRFLDEISGLKTTEVDITNSIIIEKKGENVLSLFDKDFIEQRFNTLSINATSVNKFLRCSWEYFFTTLLRFPQAPHISAQYGTVVHSTIEEMLGLRMKGETLSEEFLERSIRERINASSIPPHEKERRIEKATRDLYPFLTSFSLNDSAVEFEKDIRGAPLSLGNEDVMLSGKLDMVEYVDGEYRVTDFKTGKPKSRGVIEGTTNDSNGDYKRQLVFYSLLLEHEGKKMKEGVIQFVEPNDRGEYRRETFIITNQERERLKGEIRSMVETVRNLSFEEGACKKRACTWCTLSHELLPTLPSS